MELIKKRKHYFLIFVFGLLILSIVIFISASFGSADITFNQFMAIILNKIPFKGKFSKSRNYKIP